MSVKSSEKKFTEIILDFCYQNKYFETLTSLEKESKINFQKFHKNLEKIKKKCLAGKFEDLIKILKVFKNLDKKKFKKIKNIILKREFLELISKKKSPEILLKKLEKFKNENFDEMAKILSTNFYEGLFLDENFFFSKNRYNLFEEILNEIKIYYDFNNYCLKGKYENFINKLNNFFFKNDFEKKNFDDIFLNLEKNYDMKNENLFKSNIVQKKKESFSKFFSSSKKIKKKAVLKKQKVKKNSNKKLNNFIKKIKEVDIKNSVVILNSSKSEKKEFSFFDKITSKFQNENEKTKNLLKNRENISNINNNEKEVNYRYLENINNSIEIEAHYKKKKKTLTKI